MSSFILAENIERSIYIIRGQKVILDHDLAKLYGVKTFRLNEQVKRNAKRFPSDFMFQLTRAEKEEVIAICDNLKNLKYSPTLPYVFTEHGAVMVAAILNTEIAIYVSVQIVRAFIKLKEWTQIHSDLVQKINAMEQKYDHQFKSVFDAIRKLMEPPKVSNKQIGFRISVD